MAARTGSSSTSSTGSSGNTASFIDNLVATIFAPVQASIDAFACLPHPASLPAVVTPAQHPTARFRVDRVSPARTTAIPARIHRPTPLLLFPSQTSPKNHLQSPIAKISAAARPKKAATGERRRPAKNRYTALATYTALETPKAHLFGSRTQAAMGGLLHCNQVYLNAICPK
ncbi:hypothetical protein T484DRAFT_2868743 [Baffinella frigidus]|nr:hypothetical protein T484DRAFT_2868743 [Cryptophyta sp. CCMP2293]